mmetsp:Transcript_88511/g.236468  ORF Transcript_88511/g.236468 Transcript_88511/m.236468 type:complete len:302 (-) Transcript_88511:592-1497(-)
MVRLTFFDDAVIIRSTEPEGRDTSNARVPGTSKPGTLSDVDVDRTVRDVCPVPQCGRRLDVDAPGNDLMPERKNHFQQSSHSCCSLQVANVAFHRPHGHTLGSPTAGTQHVLQSRELDGVPNTRAGPVPFNNSNLGRIHSSPLIRSPQALLLPFYRRRIDAWGAAIGRRCQPANDGVHRVSVPNSVLQLLQYEHHAAFPDQHAIAVFVISSHPLFPAEHRRFRKRHKHAFGAISARGSSQHGLAISGQQFIRSHFNSDQGAGASSINNAVHSIKVENICCPTSSNVAEEPWERIQAPLRVL